MLIVPGHTAWLPENAPDATPGPETATVPAPAETEWELTFPGLSAGTYDVILDVPDPGAGDHESWAGQVRV